MKTLSSSWLKKDNLVYAEASIARWHADKATAAPTGEDAAAMLGLEDAVARPQANDRGRYKTWQASFTLNWLAVLDNTSPLPAHLAPEEDVEVEASY